MKVVNTFSRKPKQGADTLVWLVDSPDVEGVSAGYFADRTRIEPAPAARDLEAARRLWEVSVEQTRVTAVAPY
jgi:hypothetical protein